MVEKDSARIGNLLVKECSSMMAIGCRQQRARGAIFALACIALVLWFTACGGGGTTIIDDVPDATPGISLSEASVTFDEQPVGTTSVEQTVTVTNTGDAVLTISSLALTGTQAGDFALANGCGSSVAAGASCSIIVTFTPTATGTRTASVNITDNAAGSPHSVSLAGTGTDTAPVVGLSATSIAFGSQAVGTPSAARTVTLTNTGNEPLTISSIVVAGTNRSNFAQSNNCSSSMAASASCTIRVVFTPSARGTRTGRVTITDNAAGSPHTVSLTGTGTTSGPALNLSATSLSFGDQGVGTTSSPQSVTLTNSGSASLSITSIVLAGTHASDFTQNTTCGSSLAAAADCVIAVSFTPAATGTRTASLTITSSASGSPHTVSLSGVGSHDVVLSWTDSTSADVAGYNIYRGTVSGGPYSTKLNSSPVVAPYVDSTVQAGQTYYYVATAVASDGATESSNSNQASAAVPSP